MPPIIDCTPSEQAVLQTLHFALAWIVVREMCACGVSPWRAFLIFTGIAAVKEFGWDMQFERTTLPLETLDFACYMAGNLAATCFCKWRQVRNRKAPVIT